MKKMIEINELIEFIKERFLHFSTYNDFTEYDLDLIFEKIYRLEVLVNEKY